MTQMLDVSPVAAPRFSAADWRDLYFDQAIHDLGIGLVFTCVPQESIAKVYPPEKFVGIDAPHPRVRRSFRSDRNTY